MVEHIEGQNHKSELKQMKKKLSLDEHNKKAGEVEKEIKVAASRTSKRNKPKLLVGYSSSEEENDDISDVAVEGKHEQVAAKVNTGEKIEKEENEKEYEKNDTADLKTYSTIIIENNENDKTDDNVKHPEANSSEGKHPVLSEAVSINEKSREKLKEKGEVTVKEKNKSQKEQYEEHVVERKTEEKENKKESDDFKCHILGKRKWNPKKNKEPTTFENQDILLKNDINYTIQENKNCKHGIISPIQNLKSKQNLYDVTLKEDYANKALFVKDQNNYRADNSHDSISSNIGRGYDLSANTFFTNVKDMNKNHQTGCYYYNYASTDNQDTEHLKFDYMFNVHNSESGNFSYPPDRSFVKPREFDVDLSKIPVVKQQSFSDFLKVNANKQKKKSNKYNIKTKYYDPISNQMEETIAESKKQKQKHHINWLAKEAIEKESEILQNKGYDKKYTKDKYGW